MHKKGFTEAQITWIFILIAGSVFILIFTKIAGTQKETGEAKISGLTLAGFQSQLTSLSISQSAFHQGELPNAEMKFTCDKYSMGKSSRPLGNLIVFAPDRLKGSRYLAMTKPFEAPFKVTNFIYITHPEVRYVFVKNDASLETLYNNIKNSFPEKFEEESKDTGFYDSYSADIFAKANDLNNYKVRFVIFGSGASIPIFPNTKDFDITKLEIIDDKTIKFYKKTPSGWGTPITSYYLDESSLLGAIFSEDAENYECSMKKAFGLLENEANFYDAVETVLESKETDNCKIIHNNANSRSSINQIKASANGLKSAIADMTNIKNQISSLQTKNSDAEKQSCILIY